MQFDPNGAIHVSLSLCIRLLIVFWCKFTVVDLHVLKCFLPKTPTKTQKKEKILKKTQLRCFSLTRTYDKIGQRTFEIEEEKTENIEPEEKKREKNIVCIVHVREKKRRR